MYLPQHFRENDLPALHSFMRQHPFATIITTQDNRPIVSHLPLIFDPEPAPYGTLLGHFAFSNQQWRTFDGTQEVLVIFHGPHAYISPAWYEEPAQSVPTWNYTVVHASGVPHILEDRDALISLLDRQIEVFEEGFECPWSPEWSDTLLRKLPGVVGFTLPITNLIGKFKLNQNRSIADRERVSKKMSDAVDPAGSGMVMLMQSSLKEQTK